MATDKAKSSYQQELERRKDDLLRVYNPLKEDYVVEYDRRGGTKLFRVSSKQEEVLPRYIAEKFIKEMYNKMLIDEAKDSILKENERRIKVGMAEMDKTMKTNEQMGFEEKFYNPSEEKTRKIISLLYVGLEREYGVDSLSPEKKEASDKPAFEKGLEEVTSKIDSGEMTHTTRTDEKTPQNGSSEASEANSDEFKCDFPDCNFVAKSKLGLFSHKRTHRDETEELEEKKKQAVSQISQ